MADISARRVKSVRWLWGIIKYLPGDLLNFICEREPCEISCVRKAVYAFIYSASGILVLTALAKVTMVFGSIKLLDQPNPVLGFIHNRYLLLFAAAVEVVVAFEAIRARNVIGLLAIAWLSTVFLVYHLMLRMVGFQGYCSCLGNLSDVFHLPRNIDTLLSNVFLFYLLFGSYSLLVIMVTIHYLAHFSGRTVTRFDTFS